MCARSHHRGSTTIYLLNATMEGKHSGKQNVAVTSTGTTEYDDYGMATGGQMDDPDEQESCRAGHLDPEPTLSQRAGRWLGWWSGWWVTWWLGWALGYVELGLMVGWFTGELGMQAGTCFGRLIPADMMVWWLGLWVSAAAGELAGSVLPPWAARSVVATLGIFVVGSVIALLQRALGHAGQLIRDTVRKYVRHSEVELVVDVMFGLVVGVAVFLFSVTVIVFDMLYEYVGLSWPALGGASLGFFFGSVCLAFYRTLVSPPCSQTKQ